MVGDAIRALAIFRLDVGEADEIEVRRVLSMWRNYRELTAEQVAEVVAHFAGAGAPVAQPSCAFAICEAVDHIADRIAGRVLDRLHDAARQGTAGATAYDREPDPGAGVRGGAHYGGVDETGLHYDREPDV